MGMGGEELVRKDLQVWMTAEGEAKQKIRGSGTNQQSGSNVNNIRWNQMKAGRMKTAVMFSVTNRRSEES